jgi:hypothetical protein
MARGEQPHQGNERALLEQWLEFGRATLAIKCEGLSPQQLADQAVPPSTLSLARILRRLADMERFDTQILNGEPLAGRYDKGGAEAGPEVTNLDVEYARHNGHAPTPRALRRRHRLLGQGRAASGDGLLGERTEISPNEV